jgi:hypothetical protein
VSDIDPEASLRLTTGVIGFCERSHCFIVVEVNAAADVVCKSGSQ